MNNLNHQNPKHPLDEYADRGWSLFGDEAEAKSAQKAFDQRLQDRFQLKKKKRRTLLLLSIAASFLLLLTIGVGQFFPSGENSNSNTYAFAPAQALDITALAPDRSKNAETENLLQEGTSAYRKGDYERAAANFEGYLAAGGTRQEVGLFLGHSQLQFAPDDAIKTLEAFIASSQLDGNYSDLGRWYLAWGYELSGNSKRALVIMTELAASNTLVAKDASLFLGRK